MFVTVPTTSSAPGSSPSPEACETILQSFTLEKKEMPFEPMMEASHSTFWSCHFFMSMTVCLNSLMFRPPQRPLSVDTMI